MPEKPSRRAEHVGKRLEVLRLALGFESKREFAAEMGVDESRYTKWENGKAIIPVDFVDDLRGKFRITSDWLYYGDMSALPQTLYKELRKAS